MRFSVAHPKKLPTNQQIGAKKKKRSGGSSFFVNIDVTVIGHVHVTCIQWKQSSPVLFQVDCQVSAVNGQLIANRIWIKLSFTHQLLVTDYRLLGFFFLTMCT